MANPLPPPPPQSAVLLMLLLLISSVGGAPNSTDTQEFGHALESLRSHGYSLFTNAVTTSDLQYDLLTTTTTGEDEPPLASFTLFAPKDEMLFALDMATDAAVYVNTLRYHIIPNRRYTFADLQNLSSPFLDTLLPHFAILVGKTLNDDVFSDAAVTVMVDGVRVSSPDIFLGSRLAVHGIDGILLSGLNITQDSDAPANRSDTLPTAEPPGVVINIPEEEMFRFDWNNPPLDISKPAPAEVGGTAPTSAFHGPVSNHFDWDIVPGGVKTSPQDQMEKLKDLAKKKKEKRHRKGRRRHHHHHRRHTPKADHVFNEL